MTRTSIKQAIAEASRFLRAAKARLTEMETTDNGYPGAHTRASGACRRASLDLTRALADMRRPGGNGDD